MAKALHARPQPQEGGANPIAALLDENGVLTSEGERIANVVSDEQLRELYRMMVISRRLDQEGLNLQRQGEAGPLGAVRRPRSGAGWRGAGAGGDRLDLPLLPRLCDGGLSAASIQGYPHHPFRGLTHGAWNPYDYRFAPFIIPVGKIQVPHAVGFAVGCKLDHGANRRAGGLWRGRNLHWRLARGDELRGRLSVTVAASSARTTSGPSRCRLRSRWSCVVDRAAGYGFPGVRIDGTDVLTVYAVVKAAAQHARAGTWPVSGRVGFVSHAAPHDLR